MQLYFKKYGKGLPLLILHGLYGSSDNWHSVARILAEHYEVFVADARNHGRSPQSKVHTFEAMQEDVYNFLQEHHLENVTIIGHSMGGKTAMLFSMIHPATVSKLIIVDIAPKSYKSLLEFNPQIVEHMNILQAYASVDISQMSSRLEIDEAFSQYIKSAPLRQFLLKNAYRDDQGKFYWAINVKVLQHSLPLMMDWPKLENLKEVTTPTLFIRGEKSNYIEDKDIPELKKWFLSSDVATIFDAGHWVHSEQQELFLNTVKNFLQANH